MSSSLLSPADHQPQRPSFYRSISSTSQVPTRSSRALNLTKSWSHQKDKLRLYLALFPRGGSAGGCYGSQLSCDSYHWAIVIGPKSPLRSEAGTAYHMVHSDSGFSDTPYFYEETDLSDNPHLTRNLLARVALAKVFDEEEIASLLRSLAANLKADSRRPSTDSSNVISSDLSCLKWAKSAWETLTQDSSRPLKSYFGPHEFTDIENRARKYVKRKRAQGRYNHNTEPGDVTWNPLEVPTWNYWENRETTD